MRSVGGLRFGRQ